jgi:hypothetical protein
MSEPAQPGLLLEDDRLRVLDTREMPWAPSEYMPQSLAKTLVSGPDGEPLVLIRWYSERPPERQRPYVSYHLDRELYFILGGESPHWEFDADQIEEAHLERAKLLTLREGYWLDRAVRSPHGGGTPRSAVGLWILSWSLAGDGEFVGECESLCSAVPDGGIGRPDQVAVRHRSRGIDVLSSRELPWEPHPWLAETPIKVLSRRADGDATVTLRWLHRREAGPLTPRNPAAADFHEFVYVVDGELNVSVDGTPVRVPPGGFLDMAAGNNLRVEPWTPRAPGATILHWRVRDIGLLVSDVEKERRTVEVPYALPSAR